MHAARDLPGGGQHVTAVFAGNDRCAAGVLDTLLRAGAGVPGEVSVIGCDDSRLARLTHIDLTTVAQDQEQMAQLAVGRSSSGWRAIPACRRATSSSTPAWCCAEPPGRPLPDSPKTARGFRRKGDVSS